jgi:serine/threonine-protein kinase
VTGGVSGQTGEEQRAFLQERVARFGFLTGALMLIGYLFRAGIVLLGWKPEALLRTDMVCHAISSLPLLAVWALCRGRPRSPRFISAVEVAGILGSAAAVMVMAAHINLPARPGHILAYALALVLFARAVYIPSTWQQTLWLCCSVGVGIVVTTFVVYSSNLSAQDSMVGRAGTTSAPARAAFFMAVVIGVWWTLTTLVCVAASRVIYGLRKQAADIRKLGQYTLERRLGEGGMGLVYQASHAMLRRPTAVKLLTPEKTSERASARFEREVQQTARLSHPNTVTVYDYGRTPDGVFYYAMELIDGANLGDIVELTGAQPPARVVHILADAAAALAEAHDAGLTHRDVKPANIMLCTQGGIPDTVKVLDFGLVKELSQDSALVSVTSAATITGTPQYMSPEAIAEPESVDERSDLYALGAVGYYLLTGKHVFEARSVVEVCGAHLHSTPVAPSERLGAPIPPELEALVTMCLEKDRAMRPQSAVAFRDALLACSDVGTWTTESAREWWVEHGDDLRADRERRSMTASERTIGIDLGRR